MHKQAVRHRIPPLLGCASQVGARPSPPPALTCPHTPALPPLHSACRACSPSWATAAAAPRAQAAAMSTKQQRAAMEQFRPAGAPPAGGHSGGRGGHRRASLARLWCGTARCRPVRRVGVHGGGGCDGMRGGLDGQADCRGRDGQGRSSTIVRTQPLHCPRLPLPCIPLQGASWCRAAGAPAALAPASSHHCRGQR